LVTFSLINFLAKLKEENAAPEMVIKQAFIITLISFISKLSKTYLVIYFMKQDYHVIRKKN